MSSAEIDQLFRALAAVREAVSAVHDRYGERKEVRRLINDTERLAIDGANLATMSEQPEHTFTPSLLNEVVVVPDTPYDPKLWRDADDEGLGGLRRP